MFPLKYNQKSIIKVFLDILGKRRKFTLKNTKRKSPIPNIFRTTSDFAHLAVQLPVWPVVEVVEGRVEHPGALAAGEALPVPVGDLGRLALRLEDLPLAAGAARRSAGVNYCQVSRKTVIFA